MGAGKVGVARDFIFYLEINVFKFYKKNKIITNSLSQPTYSF